MLKDKFPKCQMEIISVEGVCGKRSSLLWRFADRKFPVCKSCSSLVAICGGRLEPIITQKEKRKGQKQPIFGISRGDIEYIFRPYIFESESVYRGSEMGTISSWDQLKKILEFISYFYNENGVAKVSKVCHILQRYQSNKLSIRANRRLMSCIVKVNERRVII